MHSVAQIKFHVNVTDVAMPVRAVCKPHSPDLKKRGAQATDTFSLLGRAPASRTRVPGSRPAQWVGADPGGLHWRSRQDGSEV